MEETPQILIFHIYVYCERVEISCKTESNTTMHVNSTVHSTLHVVSITTKLNIKVEKYGKIFTPWLLPQNA